MNRKEELKKKRERERDVRRKVKVHVLRRVGSFGKELLKEWATRE